MNPILKDNFFNSKNTQNRKTITNENIKIVDKGPKTKKKLKVKKKKKKQKSLKCQFIKI